MYQWRTDLALERLEGLENQTIPDGSLVMGSPARIARSLTEEEMKGLTQSAEHYIRIGISLRI